MQNAVNPSVSNRTLRDSSVNEHAFTDHILTTQSPHWFAVSRLSDNRMRGLMRELAELIDDERDPRKLSDIRVSLRTLADNASEKAWRLSKGKFR
jgi:hypothetical protein